MKLLLSSYGLRKEYMFEFVGFSKCGPGLNSAAFYKTDNGIQVGLEESIFGRKTFYI